MSADVSHTAIHIDELHAYDGAQGTDLACLIRRLKARLRTPPGALVAVGTSATLGSEGNERLLTFAHDVFGEPRAVRRLVNRVSVEASFFKKMSAAENLGYAARFYGLTARDTRHEIPRILERVGFPPERRGEPMENLSRGMQQKVALARALLTSPVLLLLDEPTTGLDPRSKLDVQAFIEEMRDTHDATIVLTTHDLEEADRLCDRITLINLCENKGARLFWALAARMPKTQFLAVKGAYGTQIVQDLPNVEVQEHVPGDQMRDKVYARTRVLLVPSSYESWGRVAVEAMASRLAHMTVLDALLVGIAERNEERAREHEAQACAPEGIQLGDGLLGLDVVAAIEQIALDRVVRVRQLVRRHDRPDGEPDERDRGESVEPLEVREDLSPVRERDRRREHDEGRREDHESGGEQEPDASDPPGEERVRIPHREPQVEQVAAKPSPLPAAMRRSAAVIEQPGPLQIVDETLEGFRSERPAERVLRPTLDLRERGRPVALLGDEPPGLGEREEGALHRVLHHEDPACRRPLGTDREIGSKFRQRRRHGPALLAWEEEREGRRKLQRPSPMGPGPSGGSQSFPKDDDQRTPGRACSSTPGPDYELEVSEPSEPEELVSDEPSSDTSTPMPIPIPRSGATRCSSRRSSGSRSFTDVTSLRSFTPPLLSGGTVILPMSGPGDGNVG